MTSALPNLTSSNAGRYRDRAPRLTAAGKVTSDPRENVASCVKFTSERPPTPETIAPYRKSKQEVGKTVMTKGRARDTPPPDIRFGKKNVYNEDAHTLIQADTRSLFLQKQQDLKESIYATAKAEPLGQTRKAELHGRAKDPDTRFGRVTKTSENSKDVIYPFNAEGAEEESMNHARYCRTHNSYDAGEQKSRDYNWNSHGVNPSNHRFGFVKEREVDGVRQALVHGREAKTVIVPKLIEDFKDVTRDDLGRPRNQGFGNERSLPPNFTFGKRNVADEWGVRECMTKPSPGSEGDMADKDLGKSLRPGFRNDTSGDRTFGVPSVRTDIPPPRNKKVTDSVNYGDDSNAIALLCPSKYAATNVHEEDFLEPVARERMYDLASKCKFDLSDEEFDQCWTLAETYTTNGSVSIETFRRAVDELGY